MRKVISHSFVTLDGFMAGPQGEIDWNEPYFDEEMARYVGEEFDTVGTILFGRVTYQLFVQYWPTQGVKDDPVFAEKMNTLPKIVFSKTLSTVAWNNTRLVKENVAEEIHALKRQEGKDIFIDGSPGLIQSLTRLGLIDEYRLRVHPIVLGSGVPLFKDLKERMPLKLIESKTFHSGVVILHYQPA
jgi:dihydrofolate reductase